MPTPPIKTKIAIDGEKEYKAALADINSGLKVLNSEMKLTAAQFEENSNSVEALTAKGDVLERQILSQKEKIETLKHALQSSAEAYGESDKRTSSWKASLNNAEAELVRMERELRDNREAVREAAQAAQEAENAFDDVSDAFGGAAGKSKSLGEMAEELASKLGITLPDGARKALDALGSVSAKTATLTGIATAAATAIAKIEQALINMTTEQAAAASEIYNVSRTINMSIEETQQWDYVLKTVGSSINEAQGDLSAFQEKIMEAKTGTGEAAEMFAKLGVSVVDQNGRLRETGDVLLDTINALQIMADETDRNATSSILLGNTGEKLIPIYQQSAESLQHLLEKKKELGILNGSEIEALKDVTDALIDYKERLESAKNYIAAEFAPHLEEFYEKSGIGIKTLGEAAVDSGLVETFGSLLDTVSSLLPLLESMGTLADSAAPIFNGLATTISFTADAISFFTETLAGLHEWTDDLELPIIRLNSGTGFTSFMGKVSTVASLVDLIKNNSSGNYNFDGGLTWVGENGPELAYFPQGTRIFNNQESREMGGDTFYVTIDAKNVKEFNDIVEMARAKRRKDRMG